jgi:hypothetical protein
MRIKPIVLSLVLSSLTAAGMAQEANFKPIPERNPWLPKGIYLDSMLGRGLYLYDSDVKMSGAGIRAGVIYPMPQTPELVNLRFGYFKLPGVEYKFPDYHPGNPHTTTNDSDFVNMLYGEPIRDGDRRMAGFPGGKFDAVWDVQGIEFGPQFLLPIGYRWIFGVRLSYVVDLSSPPNLSNFRIEDAKLHRRASIATGFTLSYQVTPDFDLGVGYERYVMRSSVTGKPQAWNSLGSEYLFGRRSYDIVSMSATYWWR